VSGNIEIQALALENSRQRIDTVSNQRSYTLNNGETETTGLTASGSIVNTQIDRQIRHQASLLEAGGKLDLESGGSTVIVGTQVKSGQDLRIVAGGHLALAAVVDSTAPNGASPPRSKAPPSCRGCPPQTESASNCATPTPLLAGRWMPVARSRSRPLAASSSAASASTAVATPALPARASSSTASLSRTARKPATWAPRPSPGRPQSPCGQCHAKWRHPRDHRHRQARRCHEHRGKYPRQRCPARRHRTLTLAEGDITLAAGRNTEDYATRNRAGTAIVERSRDESARNALSGEAINLAGRKLTLEAATLVTPGKATLVARETLALTAATDAASEHTLNVKKSGGWLSKNHHHRAHRTEPAGRHHAH
jgi:hypothetical protein